VFSRISNFAKTLKNVGYVCHVLVFGPCRVSGVLLRAAFQFKGPKIAFRVVLRQQPLYSASAAPYKEKNLCCTLLKSFGHNSFHVFVHG